MLTHKMIQKTPESWLVSAMLLLLWIPYWESMWSFLCRILNVVSWWAFNVAIKSQSFCVCTPPHTRLSFGHRFGKCFLPVVCTHTHTTYIHKCIVVAVDSCNRGYCSFCRVTSHKDNWQCQQACSGRHTTSPLQVSTFLLSLGLPPLR